MQLKVTEQKPLAIMKPGRKIKEIKVVNQTSGLAPLVIYCQHQMSITTSLTKPVLQLNSQLIL